MLSSCRADTENQHDLTDSNNGSTPLVTHIPVITVAQMCRAAPDLFRVGAPSEPPSQTLEQWAALQPFSGFAQAPARIYAERPLTATQIKRLALYERMKATA